MYEDEDEIKSIFNVREVKVLLRIVFNPSARKVGWLVRLRDVRWETEGGKRERSAIRSPQKLERSTEVRFGNLWKRRWIGYGL